MELLFALIFAFFSFHGDATYHQPQATNGPTISTEYSGRPSSGKINGPIIVIEDIHFKPSKTQ